jgi:putative toxin-antitoxin system antitoxin component (TIGR02293 family)
MILQDVENLLGGNKYLNIKLRTSMDLIDLTHKGVTKSALNYFIKYMDISQKQIARLLNITPRTIQKLKPKDLFKPGVSEQILKLAEVFAKGIDVFGDKSTFKSWLEQPNVALGRKVPIDLLDTRYGSDMVLDILGRIEHGIYS